MSPVNLVISLALLSAVAYYLAHSRSLALAKPLGGIRHLHSLPLYYGLRGAVWCGLPALVILCLWLMFDDPVVQSLVLAGLPANAVPAGPAERSLLLSTVVNVASGALPVAEQPAAVVAAAERYNTLRGSGQLLVAVITLGVAVSGLLWGVRRMSPQLRARQEVEKVFRWALLACASIAIFTTLGILLSVLFEALRFFQAVPLTDFLFGLEWSPQMAIREGQVGGSGAFGAVPLFVGTLLISAIALLVAVPVGLMSAIYLAEYASARMRNVAKPALEILAGVPTVVYGFFAALTVAPFIRELGATLGLSVSSESALAAGLVMGVMIIPFVSSLTDDIITAVPNSLRDGSLALGATRSETVKKVIVPAALPGIVGGVLLAASRAIGETMIVVMAAGLAARLTLNPLDTVTTITVQIVTLLVGDQEFDSPKTLAAFALGLMLFVTTLLLNVIALYIVKKYRELYD
ncbi:MAG: phosphate ABC transporter permease subunit PstC [Gammaproteobacteria bacterium]|nr:phosphate ABC transporter permease subunit PstC [Gammaproteobacteria bacterium]